jgi:pimeloyl-ACP methyl ester carboxylesterase
MIDYPGFGKTTGNRSEGIIYEQALKMYELAKETTGADSIIIYGKSIGTGVAAYVAAHRPLKQLLLETPYYSIKALAKHYFPVYPVAVLSKYNFPIFQYLKDVRAPVTILHGTSDGIIPYQHALKLKKEIPEIKLVTIRGGEHNNLLSFMEFNKAIDSALLNH